MKNSKMLLLSLAHALGLLVYVLCVVMAMQYGGKIFENANKILGSIAFLMMFVLSASVTGALVLGRPILLYWDNRKVEAVRFFGYTLGWMLVTVIIIFTVQTIF